MLVLSLLASTLGLLAISGLKQRFDRTTDITVKKAEIAHDINKIGADLFAHQRGVVVYAFARDAANGERFRRVFDEKAGELRTAIEAMRGVSHSDQETQLLRTIEDRMNAWLGFYQEIKALCDKGDPVAALTMSREKVLPLSEAMGRAADGLAGHQRRALAADREAAAQSTTWQRWMTLGNLAISLLVAVVVLWSVRDATHALKKVSWKIAESSVQIAGAAAQVASSSQSLAQGASEQAASLEQTSASAEEITSMTQKNAENSQTVAKLMSQTAERVGGANHALEQMVVSMRQIDTSSDKVSKIIKVIDEIAFQTNILALNAAVEAARAGEAGMGFAVVADEVRNLAQRSAQAAKDTAALIEESIGHSKEGITRLDQVAAAIQSITSSAGEVKTLVDEVNLGSQEQARGIEQIARAVAQMQQVTQKTAASAEESASASEEMSAQAESMKEFMGELQSLVGSEGTQTMLPAGKVAARRVPHSTSPLEAARPWLKDKAEVFPLDGDFKEF
jgi:methyl-accepting chemotaxis protein/methyl-accepting chemotaxis protein-1 (serine sensor receptor)